MNNKNKYSMNNKNKYSLNNKNKYSMNKEYSFVNLMSDIRIVANI
jgi:hypothetical protein